MADVPTLGERYASYDDAELIRLVFTAGDLTDEGRRVLGTELEQRLRSPAMGLALRAPYDDSSVGPLVKTLRARPCPHCRGAGPLNGVLITTRMPLLNLGAPKLSERLVIGCWPCVHKAGHRELWHRKSWPARDELFRFVRHHGPLLAYFAAADDLIDLLLLQEHRAFFKLVAARPNEPPYRD